MSGRYKVVSIMKQPDKPLGLTVEQDENGNLIVARILAGSTIAKTQILHPGDVILEVNGINVFSPEDLMQHVAQSKTTIQFRISPSSQSDSSLKWQQTVHFSTFLSINAGVTLQQYYVRALFNYNPADDSLLPCPELGLEFKIGDILQILDQKDPIWWQAKKVDDNGCIGLIPSLDLEERRKAYVPPEADYVHKIGICGTRIARKKRKKMYQSKSNIEFDKADLLLYEEVTKVPPLKRRTLVLVGPFGVGRRTLKGRLINSDPERFAGVIPVTSRPPREYEEDGKSYWFLEREEMERQIKEHKFLEYGEHNGNLYGTSLDSIRNVINEGRICVLDCSPPALKILHNSSEFLPYMIFIAAPGMDNLKSLYDYGNINSCSSRNLTFDRQFDRQSSIRYSSRRARTLESLASLYEEEDFKRTLEESSCLQRTYEKYLDLIIVNEDFDKTFLQVIDALNALENQYQWIPVNWVY